MVSSLSRAPWLDAITGLDNLYIAARGRNRYSYKKCCIVNALTENKAKLLIL